MGLQAIPLMNIVPDLNQNIHADFILQILHLQILQYSFVLFSYPAVVCHNDVHAFPLSFPPYHWCFPGCGFHCRFRQMAPTSSCNHLSTGRFSHPYLLYQILQIYPSQNFHFFSPKGYLFCKIRANIPAEQKACSCVAEESCDILEYIAVIHCRKTQKEVISCPIHYSPPWQPNGAERPK